MVLIAHGGGGKKRPSKKALTALGEALSEGYARLRSGAPALDTVVSVIAFLEDSGVFNAGAGSLLQLDGMRRLDASIMEGKDLRAGSVIGLEGLKNPVKAAHAVMHTPHVMFTNRGARAIAKDLEPLAHPDMKALEKLERVKKSSRETVRMFRNYFSTVGAVAIDGAGCLAAGASTGGIPLMFPGRVGDTPIIGAGVYADNALGAVSCTGLGESIVRISLAKEICMSMKTLSPSRSARLSLKRILRIGGEAGVIVLNREGRFSILHNTQYMAAGYRNGRTLSVKDSF